MPAAVRMPAVVRMPTCHSRRFKGERPIGAATSYKSQPPRPCARPPPLLVEGTRGLQPRRALPQHPAGVAVPLWQGYAPAKSLAALAGKVRLAVAGKFPIIPKGYSGLVEQLLVG